MIKIGKPHRVASSFKFNPDHFSVNDVKANIKKPRLPKNTLRVKFIKCVIGRNGDDFVQNMMTCATYYQVITFKR